MREPEYRQGKADPKDPVLGGLAMSGSDFRSSPFGLRYGFGYARQPNTCWKFTSSYFNCPDQLEKERNDLTNTIIRGRGRET
ncbi:hypothetical protein PA598K_03094 [Paenibacillus sp. 598K]|nr:hypothetical protein PA598K_03094 [Paenibacillus sp. 598K]